MPSLLDRFLVVLAILQVGKVDAALHKICVDFASAEKSIIQDEDVKRDGGGDSRDFKFREGSAHSSDRFYPRVSPGDDFR